MKLELSWFLNTKKSSRNNMHINSGWSKEHQNRMGSTCFNSSKNLLVTLWRCSCTSGLGGRRRSWRHKLWRINPIRNRSPFHWPVYLGFGSRQSLLFNLFTSSRCGLKTAEDTRMMLMIIWKLQRFTDIHFLWLGYIHNKYGIHYQHFNVLAKQQALLTLRLGG